MTRVCMVAYTHYETDPRVRREAGALAGQGHQVDFLCLKEPGYLHKRVVDGVRVVPLRPFRYRGHNQRAYVVSYLVFFLNVLRYLGLRAVSYDVIHFHTMPDFIVFAGLLPKLCGRKIIIDFHDVMHAIFANRFAGGGLAGCIKVQTRWAARFAHRVITVNAACRDIYIQLGVPADKITIIHNFPDERLFFPPEPAGPGDGFSLVCHGTVMERLGFDTLVRSLALLKDKIPGIRLTILGKGDYEPTVRALIETLGVGSMIDYPQEKLPVDRIPARIAACSLGVVPTKIGPGTDIMLPLKLLEYIAMNIPVISTPLPAVAELCGDTVLYFKSDDAADLAAQIMRYYRQQEVLGPQLRTGMQVFRATYNWEKEKAKLFTLYEALL